MALYDPSEMVALMTAQGDIPGLDKTNNFPTYTQEWRERNVDILIDLLAEHTKPENFDMGQWINGGAKTYGASPREAKVVVSEYGCGTSACAGGHAAIAGIGFPENHYGWRAYLNETFGWEYMGCWNAQWGGDPLGAAERLQYVKNGGTLMFTDV